MNFEFVRRAVEVADLNALRTALYQATGDRHLRDLPFSDRSTPSPEFDAPEAAIIKARAIRFFAEEAERFQPQQPDDALLRELLELTLGASLSDGEFQMHRTAPGFDEFPRAVEWSGERPTLSEATNVAIVGAGLSGIAMGVHLTRLGIPYTIYERRHEVGGTWSINTYPDARVDTASSTYEYRFVKNYPWTEYFARQPEVRSYLEHVAREFGVFENIVFEADLATATFAEDTKRWELVINRPDGTTLKASAKFVVSATGLFAVPKRLNIHGVESFAGEILHTTEWNAEHTAAGKKMAIIGNGSTGVQLLSRIAASADHVYAFQRTPQWIAPRTNYGKPLEAETLWLYENMPYYWNWTRFTPTIPLFGMGDLIVPDPEWQASGGHFNKANDALREQLTQYIESQLGDRKDLIERLVPDYPPMARRLIVDNAWYKTLTQEHVDLVTDPITAIEPDAIVTANGTRYEVDLILAAVGFSVTKYLWPSLYRGRDGERLEDLWSMDNGGPRAYAGITVPKFPNLFIMYGPNAQPVAGGLGTVAWIEIWAAYIAQLIVAVIEGGKDLIEVDEGVFEHYNRTMDEKGAGLIFADPSSAKQNYYVNETGRLQTSNPWLGDEYFSYLAKPDLAAFHLS